MIVQVENRGIVEIVCCDEDVLVAHHRVSGMSFIPDGYAVPAVVRDAWVEAKSQLIASAPTDTDTQPPSPKFDNKWHGDNEVEEESSLPPQDVYLGSQEI